MLNNHINKVGSSPAHLENLQNIPVRITTRSYTKSHKLPSRKHSNLIAVPFNTQNADAAFQNSTSVLRKRLRFACVNSRSVRNKIAVIIDHMVDSGIDICTITETWLKECDSVSIAGLSTAGFVFRSFPRQSGRSGGGTGILCKESLNVKSSDCGEFYSFEFSEWNVCVHKQTIKVVTIYRPPYSEDHPVSSNVFFEEFSSYLENIVMIPEVLLITGDFNFHVDCPTEADAKKFAELMNTFGLIQHVRVPTHSSGHTLDLIITRSINDVTITSPLATFALSDHFFVECLLDIPRPNILVKEVYYRKIKHIDLDAFKADICASDLSQKTWSSVNEMSKSYDTTLRSILDKHAPLKSKVMTVRPMVPWFNDSLKKLKAKRRKLERIMLKSKLECDKNAYRKVRDDYSALLNDTRRMFYSNLIDKSAGDSRKLFQIVNSLSKERLVEEFPENRDPSILANEFGEFFCKKIDVLKSKIDEISINPPDVPFHLPEVKLDEFSSVSEDEVRRIILESSNASSRLDPIPTSLVKLCCHELAPIIAEIINLSFAEGIVPDHWKIALVLPILKKFGLDFMFENFRPISNLPFVAKSAEKATISQLSIHCVENAPFPECQSAYRKNHSTETALLKIQNDILLSMDRQEVTLLVLIDLSAAFDTIDHAILLETLEKDFGVTGNALKWLTSYLSERKQTILIKDHESEVFNLQSGVPQGSCLGPVLGEFFCKKIDVLKSKIDEISINPPDVPFHLPEVKLDEFSSVSEDEVRRIILESSNASSRLDPIPTSLVKLCCHELAPIIAEIINLSFAEGIVPDHWKIALVLPILKKFGLDFMFENFRPISNLPFVAKSAEKATISQLSIHCVENAPFPECQSAYRKNHSTETALLKIQNDILLSMDRQEVTLLVLIDLSAAFDTIDHAILLETLEKDFGVTGNALKWLTSYLSERKQTILIKDHESEVFNLQSGVPQGSCLGPVLFILYVAGLFKVIDKHLPNAHTYADDTQIYHSFRPDTSLSQDAALKSIENCVADIRAWMLSNRLLINDSKTEFIIIGSKQQLSKININEIRVGESTIEPVEVVQSLGMWFDSHMSMDIHIGKVCSKAFRGLYNIRQIRKFLSEDTTKILVHAFVTSHLDYCNSLFYGLPQSQYDRLQKVLNAAARVVCLIPKFDHITPVLIGLHWLPVKYRVIFKILLLVYKALHANAPPYLSDLLTPLQVGCYSLRSNEQNLLIVPKTVRKTFGDRAFAKAGPFLWNELPIDIREASTVETFKNRLKTFLFKKAFYS